MEDEEAEGVDEDVPAVGIEGPGSSTCTCTASVEDEGPAMLAALLAADEEDEAAPLETEGE